MGAGLLSIYSANSSLFFQQLISVVLGLILLFGLSVLNWKALKSYPMIILAIYLAALTLLVLTLFFAPTIRGIKGWIVIGTLRFQVAEFMKVALIILFSYFFSYRHIGIARLTNIFKSFVYLAIPSLLIFLQPDMGSVIVLVAIWAGFLMVSGIKLKHFLTGVVVALLALLIAWFFVLAPYQQERIVGFFQPDYDPLGVNYSTIQAKIAIGSGGLFGQGYGRGTQTQLGFLPEAATDFVYASLIEEWGLFGGVLVLVAFLILILRTIHIGLFSESNFYRLLCLGSAILFLTQFIINVGSATGMLPVIGLTFPFLSYGGSSIIVNCVLLGMIQSARRFAHQPRSAILHSDIMFES